MYTPDIWQHFYMFAILFHFQTLSGRFMKGPESVLRCDGPGKRPEIIRKRPESVNGPRKRPESVNMARKWKTSEKRSESVRVN